MWEFRFTWFFVELILKVQKICITFAILDLFYRKKTFVDSKLPSQTVITRYGFCMVRERVIISTVQYRYRYSTSEREPLLGNHC